MFEFIINAKSKSGGGEKIWLDIEKYLKNENIEYRAHITEYAGHAQKIIAELEKANKLVNLVVIGGDGTFNEVINGINDFEVFNIGYIPAGSGNDFARGMGISNDYLKNIKKIIEYKEYRKCDLGMIVFPDGKEKRFAISCGMGLDAEVCYYALTSKIKKFLNFFGLGQATYIILTILRLFSMKTASAIVKTDMKKQENFERLIFLAFMNQKYEGGGVQMAPRALYNDGRLDIINASGINKYLCFFLLPMLAMGKSENIKGIKTEKIEKTEVKLSRPMIFHTDGEYAGTYDEAIVSNIPGCLKLLN